MPICDGGTMTLVFMGVIPKCPQPVIPPMPWMIPPKINQPTQRLKTRLLKHHHLHAPTKILPLQTPPTSKLLSLISTRSRCQSKFLASTTKPPLLHLQALGSSVTPLSSPQSLFLLRLWSSTDYYVAERHHSVLRVL